MICENCTKREATIHFTEIIKNVRSEYHLCEICAKDIRLNLKLQNCSNSMQEILSFLDNENINKTNDINCMNCGLTLTELKNEKKLGCPICYNYFHSSLESVISYYHKETRHKGKIPNNYVNIKRNIEENELAILKDNQIELDNNIENLKEKLESAVIEERYEDAAILRDLVKELESVK